MPLGGSLINRGAGPRLSQGRVRVSDIQQSFGGGLNSVSSEDALAPNQIRRADNGRLTIFGAFTKRGGTQITSTALSGTNVVQNGAPWYQAAGTTVTIAVSQGTVFTTTYGAFPLTWTQRGSPGAIATSVTPSFAQFISGAATETMYIADGGLLNKYAGTTLTVNLASTPSCNFLCVHNQRLWGCGDPTYPDSVFYSALNDGDSLGVGASSGGQIIDRSFGKSNLIGLCSLGTSLMMFHGYGVSRLTGFGQSDITVSPAGISGDVGSIAPFSIARVDDQVYFVTERGLYVATENSVDPINTPARPDPLAVVLPSMSKTNIANVRAILNRGTRELWIMVPGYGVYVFHTILQAWSGPWADGYESPEVNCLFETNNASNYPIVLAGDASGFVRLCDAPNLYMDNVASAGTGGTSYVATLQCRRFFCGDPHTAKSFRYAYLLANLGGSAAGALGWTDDSSSGTYQFPASTGNTWNASGTVWNAAGSVWNASGQTSYRVDVDGEGYYLDLTFTDSGSAAPVISQARVEGFALGRR